MAVCAVLVLFLWPGSESGDASREAELESKSKAASKQPRSSAVAPLPSIPGAPRERVRLTAAVVDEVEDANGRFEGTVINWGSGQPVASAEVVFRSGEVVSSVHTNGEGHFVFVPPERGSFGLATISADGFLPYAPAWGAGAIALVARSRVRIRGLIFYLTPAVRYRGRVVDSDAKPVAGATVGLISSGEGQVALLPIATDHVSDADGRFEFLAPDYAVLRAHHEPAGSGEAVLDDAVQISHEMVIVVKPEAAKRPATVAGVVVDASGEAVAAARVRAYEEGDWSGIHDVVADELGRFTIETLEKTKLKLGARADGFSVGVAVVSTAGPGSRTETTITLGRSAAIAGRVVSETGTPVPAFSILVNRRDGVAERLVTTGSFFDADGTFEITDLGASSYVLRAAAYGFAASEPVDATASTSDLGSIVLTLPRGGTLTGRVIDEETQKPLEGARVSVEAMGGGDSAQPIASSVVTDDKGEFELSGIPPGRASVVAGAFEHHSRIIGGLVLESGGRLGPIEIALTATKEGERPGLELAGIGAQLSGNEDGLEVQALIEGGGGIEAGIVVGDLIVSVDGQKVADIGLRGAISLIRGPVDTPVRLGVRRKTGDEVEITALRRKIRA